MGVLREEFESFVERAMLGEGGVSVPEEAVEAYLCDALGLKPHELAMMDRERIECYVGYLEGKRIAQMAGTEGDS